MNSGSFPASSNAPFGHIRAVVLDAVGTLIHPAEPVAVTYRRTIERICGQRVSEEHIKSSLRLALQSRHTNSSDVSGARSQHSRSPCDRQPGADRDLMTSEQAEREFWYRLIESLCPDPQFANDCFQYLFEHFEQPDAWQLYDDVIDTLTQLQQAKYQLAIASNFDRRLHIICDALLPLKQIAWRFISSETGWKKPSLRFYQSIASAMNMPPSELLMAGDDRANDVDAAVQAGLSAVWLCRQSCASAERSTLDERSALDIVSEPVVQIRSLGELPDLLRQK